MVLLTGTLLAYGRRTVTTALRHPGNQMESTFSTFHQVLNRARWSPLAVSRQLLSLIIHTFVYSGGTIDLVLDETLERRWGANISKGGHYRESALSSRKHSVSSPGLRGTRDGGCRHLALDHTAVGFTIFLCPGNDP